MRFFQNFVWENRIFLENKADVILHGHARDYDDIILMLYNTEREYKYGLEIK